MTSINSNKACLYEHLSDLDKGSGWPTAVVGQIKGLNASCPLCGTSKSIGLQTSLMHFNYARLVKSMSYIHEKLPIRYTQDIYSYSRSVAYMRQWTRSALVLVVACRLCGAKPIPVPILTFLLIGPLRTNLREIRIQTFLFTKMHLKMSYAKWWAILSRGLS